MTREPTRSAIPRQADGLPSLAGLDLAAVAESRWFASKGRSVVAAAPVAALELPSAHGSTLVVAELRDDEGGAARYTLPLTWRHGVPSEVEPDDALWPALAAAATTNPHVAPGPGRVLSTDQSNAAVVLGEALVVKVIRLVDEGASPEAEALQALDELDGVPRLRGSIELAGSTVVLLQDLVPAAEAGWEPAIERLVAVAAGEGADEVVARAEALGALVGRVHLRLAERLGVEPASAERLAARRRLAEERLDALLSQASGELVAELAPRASLLRDDLGRFDGCVGTTLSRIHGDLHLGQVLWTVDGLPVIVDFDGEPGRPTAERLERWTPARDVASLLLSYDNAAAAARRRCAARGIDAAGLQPVVDAARAAALSAWEATVSAEVHVATSESGHAPGRPAGAFEALLRACFAEKQIAELAYADRFLPEWLYAPLDVLRRRFGDDG